MSQIENMSVFYPKKNCLISVYNNNVSYIKKRTTENHIISEKKDDCLAIVFNVINYNSHIYLIRIYYYRMHFYEPKMQQIRNIGALRERIAQFYL